MQKQTTLQITLADKSIRTVPKGTTGLNLAKMIKSSLAKQVLAIKVNGDIWDVTRPFTQDTQVQFFTWEEPEGKQVFWHSTAHVLAEALLHYYPKAKLGIGPPIANGFYYDVDFGDTPFDTALIPAIEKRVIEMARQKDVFTRIESTKKEAIAHYTQNHNPYKVEILKDLPGDVPITFYKQGKFMDLCKGPHLPHTGYVKAMKIGNIAGAYWRGDTNRKQLTRIYGISFPQQKELQTYLVRIEEAKKRDHRKLGERLKLFTFSSQVGLGLPLWLPRGAVLRQQLVQFLHKAQLKSNYQSVITPHIAHKNLYITSGHYEKYGENSFQPIKTPHEGEEYLLKPMNCPHHCEIYKSQPRSYKELPLKFAEFGTVYRYEQHGELQGLARTRGFTQDDAHIFCTPEQVKQEIKEVLKLVRFVLQKLSFEKYTVQISLRDSNKADKYMGDSAEWTRAEKALQEAVEEEGLIATSVLGEAAFYGPKIDFMVQDALERNWQLGTVQLDYQLPQRFELEYVGADNQKHRPVMIHRAPFGSLERFIALLLEHTNGKLPLWLAPTQVAILPISDQYNNYAQKIYEILATHDIRTTVDTRDEKIGRKIREQELLKVPYMLILGQKEAEAQNVTLRKQAVGDQGSFSIKQLLQRLQEEVALGQS